MNSPQAKEVLLRYRPGTSDDRDPEVRAALQQASRDPRLAAWLEEHQRFQEHVQERLSGLEPPAGLREQILSEKRANLSGWRSPRRLVAGSLAVLLLVLGFAFLAVRDGDEENRFATFRSRMVKTALRGYAMDLETPDAAEIRDYLGTRQAPSGRVMSPGLDAAPLMGCAVLTWRGKPASMICYGNGPRPELWLFVVDSDALPDAPAGSALLIEKVNRLNTVSWTRDGQTYVLAGEGDATRLRELLRGGT
jgi:hypothetical protein